MPESSQGEAVARMVYDGSRDAIEPAFVENNVPIFFGCDINFFPHALVVIASIMEHADVGRNYDIFIVEAGIPDSMIERSLAWVKQYPNVSLRFIDVGSLVEKVGRDAFKTTRRYSLAVYFRLFATSLFPAYDKMVFLDADIVVFDDISKLYDVELGDTFLAAAIDYVSNHQSLQVPDIADYWRNELGKEPGTEYFLAGGAVLNLRKMREERIEEAMLQKLISLKNPRLLDQDIMNSVIGDKFISLDATWNYLDWMLDESEESIKYGMVSKDDLAVIRHARSSVKILHYSDKKPWCWDYAGRNAKFYWRYARKTPLFTHIVNKLEEQSAYKKLLFRYLVTTFQVGMFLCKGVLAKDKKRYRERVVNISGERRCIVNNLKRKLGNKQPFAE